MKVKSEEKIYATLRSLFRYSQLRELDAPDILFENEEKIIIERIGQLTPEEIFLTVVSWNSYYDSQGAEDQILDIDATDYFQSLN
ncbi:MAG: hypothetical protein Q8P20_09465 [bacterium]|nr:hypothetical protein [bacterium]